MANGKKQGVSRGQGPKELFRVVGREGEKGFFALMAPGVPRTPPRPALPTRGAMVPLEEGNPHQAALFYPHLPMYSVKSMRCSLTKKGVG